MGHPRPRLGATRLAIALLLALAVVAAVRLSSSSLLAGAARSGRVELAKATPPIAQVAANPAAPTTISDDKVRGANKPTSASGASIHKTPTASPHDLSPTDAGFRIAVDPETGGLVAPQPDRALTIEEMQALARQEAVGLVTIRNADGSETLNHEGRFTDYSIVRLGKDGKPVFDCTSGEGQIRHALRSAPPTPTQAPEED